MRLNLTSDLKVILVGDPSVGKTSIISQYNMKMFEPVLESTIGASFVSRSVNTSNGPICLHIWDTAGQERFRSLIPMYARNADASVLVFDVTSQPTFDNLCNWITVIRETASPNCRIYIVANKIDLDNVVNIEEAEQWAINQGFKFFTMTATSYESVSSLFRQIAEEIIEFGISKLPNLALRPSIHRTKRSNTGCC